MSIGTTFNMHRAQCVTVRTVNSGDTNYIIVKATGDDESDYSEVAIFLDKGVNMHKLEEELVLAGQPKAQCSSGIAEMVSGLTEGQKVHLANHLWKHYQIGAQKLLRGSE